MPIVPIRASASEASTSKPTPQPPPDVFTLMAAAQMMQEGRLIKKDQPDAGTDSSKIEGASTLRS